MLTMIRKNNRVLRTLLLLAVPLATTLVLLISTVGLHSPGFSPLSFAHATMLQATCASTQGTQANLCNQQNPVTQGCVQDAQLTERVSVFTAQNTLIGEVDLRHSNRCKAYWVRTIAYANTQVQAVHALILLNDGNEEALCSIEFIAKI
jgi:Protein of unknown function (DUF2690)